MAAAILLHLDFVFCLEDGLPGQVQTAAIVAHIHDTLRNELVPDRRVDSAGYLHHIRYHGLSSLRRRLDTVEEQSHWPIALVCALVMEGYVLLSWIFCSGEYLIAERGAWRRTIDVVERLTGNTVYNRVDRPRVGQIEPSETDGAVFQKSRAVS